MYSTDRRYSTVQVYRSEGIEAQVSSCTAQHSTAQQQYKTDPSVSRGRQAGRQGEGETDRQESNAR
jgi:hypothetical protein